ncbi:VanZ family protein [Noviherbaspirillum aerium]|uniref:VanZ family protein n=1 Tax=Noviherbaspirillum aerium TaxID=2588497 RepID=UPI00124E08D6|nr:VanZ family protein [Noviherbaspirillum aerium]
MSWPLAAFAFFVAGISVGCLTPARLLPRLPNDKLMHFLAYLVLSLIATRIASSLNEFLCWAIGLFCLGVFIEFLQDFLPDRKFCWKDVGANTAGIVLIALFSPHLVLIR